MGLKNVFSGEGADEHFGGYTKPYIEGWVNHHAYIAPTYKYVHDHFDLNLRFPFMSLNWLNTRKYFSSPEKYELRNIYRGIIPDSVITCPKQPPAFRQYWEKELKRCMPTYSGDPYLVLQMKVAEAWTRAIRERVGLIPGLDGA